MYISGQIQDSNSPLQKRMGERLNVRGRLFFFSLFFFGLSKRFLFSE